MQNKTVTFLLIEAEKFLKIPKILKKTSKISLKFHIHKNSPVTSNWTDFLSQNNSAQKICPKSMPSIIHSTDIVLMSLLYFVHTKRWTKNFHNIIIDFENWNLKINSTSYAVHICTTTYGCRMSTNVKSGWKMKKMKILNINVCVYMWMWVPQSVANRYKYKYTEKLCAVMNADNIHTAHVHITSKRYSIKIQCKIQ